MSQKVTISKKGAKIIAEAKFKPYVPLKKSKDKDRLINILERNIIQNDNKQTDSN